MLAYAGEWSREKHEKSGWLLCDGRSLKSTEYPGLFGVIGKSHGDGSRDIDPAMAVTGCDFNLPDCRGLFLRGADSDSRRDPDAASRTAIRPGGAIGREIGSLQRGSTRRPDNVFITGYESAQHTHKAPTSNGVAGQFEVPLAARNGGLWQVDFINGADTSGQQQHHMHAITDGGDKETRPINLSVNWIIKVRSIGISSK